jgi:pyruvate kinase
MKIDNKQNTKIVATIGPASSSFETLEKLVGAGVDVFRLNFSHGSHKDHKEVIERITEVNIKHNVHIGILADLQGPKLRVGKIKFNALKIEKGDILTFVNEECIGTMEKIYMSYARFASDVEIGERVLVDDGKIILEVIETNQKDTVKLKVVFGGTLSSNKGVNLPDTQVTQPALTEKDLRDIDFIVEQHAVNWIALSFVRSSDDVKLLRKLLIEKGHHAKIISKIEKPEAIKNLKSIIKASNAIMIARGDLGVELPMEKLPPIQKKIIHECIQRARPVIVATQMMDSMTYNPSPTRAEISDVANAVLDGCDAVMLSGETSVGNHPVKVVQAMNQIIAEAEKHYHWTGRRPKPSAKSNTFISDVICINSAKVAEDIKAKAIIGMTISGYTAFKISSYRPNCKIYIFSERHTMLSTLNLVWGVRCYYYDKFTTTDDTVNDVVEILSKDKVVRKGDRIVNTGTMPLQEKGRTNMMKVTIVQ